jgi:hypothetical protein
MTQPGAKNVVKNSLYFTNGPNKLQWQELAPGEERTKIIS